MVHARMEFVARTAIVGAGSPEQVDGWIAAGSLTLEPRDLAEIASALERTQAGAGPTRP